MLAIALALGSSFFWGLSDYLGGVRSRIFPVPVVLAMMYGSSLVVMAIFVGARGEGPPGTEPIIAGLCAGLFGIAALGCFYRALAIGTMSIVAPVASTGVALPVLVGLATGDEPGLMRSIGLAAAVVGVVLASRDDVGWALLLSRIAATPFVVAFAVLALRGGGVRLGGRGVLALCGIGML